MRCGGPGHQGVGRDAVDCPALFGGDLVIDAEDEKLVRLFDGVGGSGLGNGGSGGASGVGIE
jgi:hypothetical protein